MNMDMYVAGIPLVAVVIGLVSWTKTLGLSGRMLTVTSMAIGIVLGVGYKLAAGVPTDSGGWFAAVVFGIMVGLIASGIYDAARGAVSGAVRDAYDSERGREMKF